MFYLKMKGDYYGYLAEVAIGQERKDIMNQSKEAYMRAFDVAKKEMLVSDLADLLHNKYNNHFSHFGGQPFWRSGII